MDFSAWIIIVWFLVFFCASPALSPVLFFFAAIFGNMLAAPPCVISPPPRRNRQHHQPDTPPRSWGQADRDDRTGADLPAPQQRLQTSSLCQSVQGARGDAGWYGSEQLWHLWYITRGGKGSIGCCVSPIYFLFSFFSACFFFFKSSYAIRFRLLEVTMNSLIWILLLSSFCSHGFTGKEKSYYFSA